MPLASGTGIGHHQIIALIGKGGMGEVYRARDLKLGRDVALKTLPPSFAHDPERRARFQREAHVLAALNHPNIAAIYGTEDSGDTHALTMELVEGPTLTERLSEGPIPMEESIRIARQIAEALEAAHDKGITHRDLKPANVKITPDGTVKLLDFGLARAFDPAATPPVSDDPTNSPTLTHAMTGAGMILGTAAYMSPEQARGKTADRRADIWSFGVVLYEMLSGKRAFVGETTSDVLAAVLTRAPDFSKLPRETPQWLKKLLERCLERDPKKRLQAIGEARLLIDAPPEARTAPSARPWKWITATAALGVLAVGVTAAYVFRERPQAPQSHRYTVPAPEGTRFVGVLPVLTPDGRNLIFRALSKQDGEYRLYVRSLDRLEPRVLPGTEGGFNAFASADSRSVGFFVANHLKRVDLAGGLPVTLAAAPGPTTVTGGGGAWSSEGVIVFSPDRKRGLLRLASTGGPPVEFTRFDLSRRENFHAWPSFLPDQRHVLYYAQSVLPENRAVYVKPLDGGPAKRLLSSTSSAKYVPIPGSDHGYLLFVRESTLLAQPFDPRQLALTGEPVPVAEGVGLNPSGQAYFAVTPQGTLAFTGGQIGQEVTHWVNRAGVSLGVLGPVGRPLAPALSPDSTRAMVARGTFDKSDIWIHDLVNDRALRFTFSAAGDTAGVWSPDGRSVAFASRRAGSWDIFRKESRGTGKVEPLLKSAETKFPLSWSPDGRFLLYSTTSNGLRNLWVLPLDGKRKPFPFLQSVFDEREGQFSPDGRWIAYASNESGVPEVYVLPFSPDGTRLGAAKYQVSAGGGAMPRWRRDQKEMYYVAPNGKMMAVPVKSHAQRAFEAGKPQPLFDSRIDPTRGTIRQYDVTPDGQRFLVVVPADSNVEKPPEITVVSNWLAALKR